MIEIVKSIVELAIQIKNGIKKYANVSVKIMVHTNKIIVGIVAYMLSICNYLKGIVDDAKVVYDETIYVMDIVSTNVASTILANVTSTMLTSYDEKK